MPTKQNMVEIAKTSRDKGTATNGVSKSDHATLASCFPGSPILSERISDAVQKSKFFAVLASPALNTPDGTFNMMFGGAPDLSTVAYANPGDPASPYVPNPASSPSGNAADQPAPPAGYGLEPLSDGYGEGPTANAPDRNPAITSAKVAATIGETLTLGSSS